MIHAVTISIPYFILSPAAGFSGKGSKRLRLASALLARRASDIEAVSHRIPGWRISDGTKICWTDKFTHLWPAISFR